MSITITCPTCDYTIIEDEIVIPMVCNVCRLAHQTSKLSVAELWRFLDILKNKEDAEGNYTYSAIEERMEMLNEQN